mmetsp:Transcript_24367/g.48510  ORF Transcript_24367/g.48510 Transcript_24367/m.48510 type:complete len:521 (-) Transcript_24367:72-1634(-)
MILSITPVAVFFVLGGLLIHETHAVGACDGEDAAYCRLFGGIADTLCSFSYHVEQCPQTCCDEDGEGEELKCPRGKDKGLPDNYFGTKCKDIKKTLFLCNFPAGDGKLIKDYCCKTCKKKSKQCKNVKKFHTDVGADVVNCRNVVRKKSCESTHNDIPLKNFCPESCNSCPEEPTSSPTLPPTLSNFPSPAPSQPTPCEDDDTFRRNGFSWWTCAFAGKKWFGDYFGYKRCSFSVRSGPDNPRKYKYVYEACPETCGRECSDPPTAAPSVSPAPTVTVTAGPSLAPTGSPSAAPSAPPSGNPTGSPSASHTPSAAPSGIPSAAPSAPPSGTPSESPSAPPSGLPSGSPSTSRTPSAAPSGIPSGAPSAAPSDLPSVTPSVPPSGAPSESLSDAPSAQPSSSLVPTLSSEPTFAPAFETTFPTFDPTSSFAPTETTLDPTTDGTILYPSLSPAPTSESVPSSAPMASCVDEIDFTFRYFFITRNCEWAGKGPQRCKIFLGWNPDLSWDRVSDHCCASCASS